MGREDETSWLVLFRVVGLNSESVRARRRVISGQTIWSRFWGLIVRYEEQGSSVWGL